MPQSCSLDLFRALDNELPGHSVRQPVPTHRALVAVQVLLTLVGSGAAGSFVGDRGSGDVLGMSYDSRDDPAANENTRETAMRRVTGPPSL